MSVRSLLAPGTAAAAGSAVEVSQVPITLFLSGTLLTTTDVINIQFSPDNGTTWLNLFDYAKGGQVQFTASISAIVLDGAGLYRPNRAAIIATSTGVVANDADFRA